VLTPSLRLPYEITGPVQTARLLIRTMAIQDVDDIHAYQSREDVCRYLPYMPRSRDEVAEKVAQFSEAIAIAEDGDYWQLAIERVAEPDRVIGDVYFSPPEEHRQCDRRDRLDAAPCPRGPGLHD
jgi:RimJ/RimL family protein N-acetyltransferase